MKYYIYLSDSKVDMLYPQIPKPLLKKISSSLSIDLKLLGAEISVSGKSNSSNETRYSKVRIVSEFIEKHFDVGSVDAPSTYFKGTLQMWWMQPNGKEVVLFGGTTDRTILGLAGSMRHVIGMSGNPETVALSNLPYILDALLRQKEEVDIHKNAYSDIVMLVVSIVQEQNNLLLSKQRLEFLAKTLLQDSMPDRRPPSFEDIPSHVVLGTPIYVALAD